MFKGIHYKTGKPIKLTCEHGIISKMEDLENQLESTLPMIAPGLVDLQINGYKGNDFNSFPLSKEVVIETTKELWTEGVTTYFPTLITNGDLEIEHGIRAIIEACEENDLVEKCIAGIHLEGPFISKKDGPRGAHDKEYVKPPDWLLFQHWQKMAKGKIKLITLSPEWEGSITFIEKCKENGVTVSIGHTAATPEQIQKAVVAGARVSTHLGNGAHLMLPRHPHYIWEQLAQDELWACCIADGFHLPDSVIKVIFKVKKEKALLVSDAVYLTGLEPGNYNTHIGGQVILTEEGKLHLSENPNLLAGSVQMIRFGIEHLITRGICDFTDAWESGSTRPANAMNLPEKDGLIVGAKADFVFVNHNGNKVNIVQTVKNGQIVYQDTSCMIP